MAKQTFTTGQVLTAAQMTSLQQTAMGGGDTTAKTTSYVLVAADAGTTVAMNAAGSTTITVNTGLFAAGDTVFIQNRGAGICTITAGTATVNTHGSLALSQYEGGQLYFTATGAAIFFDVSQSTGMTNPMTTTGDTIYSSSGSTPARLGIGSTGQVLTVAGGVPTWATPAGGGGKVLQVVEARTTTQKDSATSTYVDSNLTATITPSSATSKVLVMVAQNGLRKSSGSASNALAIRLMRDASQLQEIFYIGYTNSALTLATASASFLFLDSPSTTSATTYKTQIKSQLNTADVGVQYNDASSAIVLLEIGA